MRVVVRSGTQMLSNSGGQGAAKSRGGRTRVSKCSGVARLLLVLVELLLLGLEELLLLLQLVVMLQ